MAKNTEIVTVINNMIKQKHPPFLLQFPNKLPAFSECLHSEVHPTCNEIFFPFQSVSEFQGKPDSSPTWILFAWKQINSPPTPPV